MKRTFLLPLLLCTLLLGTLTACQSRSPKDSLTVLHEDASYQELKNTIAGVNDQCPVDLGLPGQMMSATLTDRLIQFEIAINPVFKDLPKLRHYRKELTGLAAAYFGELLGDEGIDEMKRLGLSIKYTYRIRADEDPLLEVDIAPGDLEKERNVTRDWRYYDHRLEMSMNIGNLMAPMQVDEVTTLVRSGKEGKVAFYEYEIDEDQVDFDALRQNAGQLRQNILDLFASDDPTMSELAELARKAGATVSYRYRGSRTGQTLHVDFTPDDMP